MIIMAQRNNAQQRQAHEPSGEDIARLLESRFGELKTLREEVSALKSQRDAIEVERDELRAHVESLVKARHATVEGMGVIFAELTGAMKVAFEEALNKLIELIGPENENAKTSGTAHRQAREASTGADKKTNGAGKKQVEVQEDKAPSPHAPENAQVPAAAEAGVQKPKDHEEIMAEYGSLISKARQMEQSQKADRRVILATYAEALTMADALGLGRGEEARPIVTRMTELALAYADVVKDKSLGTVIMVLGTNIKGLNDRGFNREAGLLARKLVGVVHEKFDSLHDLDQRISAVRTALSKAEAFGIMDDVVVDLARKNIEDRKVKMGDLSDNNRVGAITMHRKAIDHLQGLYRIKE